MEEVESQNTVLGRIAATAFNRETATYRGDNGVIDKTQQRFSKDVDLAKSMGFSDLDISRAETTGRLKAATEEGKSEEADFYRKSLGDLDENA